MAKLKWRFPTLEEFKEGLARTAVKIEAMKEESNHPDAYGEEEIYPTA